MKIKVTKDPSNNSPNNSTNIIVSSLNSALKETGAYDDGGDSIHYDCLGSKHGTEPSAMICVYETVLPDLVVQNIGNTPALGVSRDNLSFLTQGGLNPRKCNYFNLGVDSQKWEYVYDGSVKEEFTFLAYCESNTRGCLDITINAFCDAFSSNPDVKLVIKDRATSNRFRQHIQEAVTQRGVKIEIDDRETNSPDEVLKLAGKCQAAICLNRSSTWDMKALECLSMGLPVISNSYSGHREYIINEFTGLEVDFELEEISDEAVNKLSGLGLNNYLLPRHFYSKTPYWSVPYVSSVSNAMKKIMDENLRSSLSFGARTMAEKLTWQRSSVNLLAAFSEIV